MLRRKDYIEIGEQELGEDVLREKAFDDHDQLGESHLASLARGEALTEGKLFPKRSRNVRERAGAA